MWHKVAKEQLVMQTFALLLSSLIAAELPEGANPLKANRLRLDDTVGSGDEAHSNIFFFLLF